LGVRLRQAEGRTDSAARIAGTMRVDMESSLNLFSKRTLTATAAGEIVDRSLPPFSAVDSVNYGLPTMQNPVRQNRTLSLIGGATARPAGSSPTKLKVPDVLEGASRPSPHVRIGIVADECTGSGSSHDRLPGSLAWTWHAWQPMLQSAMWPRPRRAGIFDEQVSSAPSINGGFSKGLLTAQRDPSWP
jgi:hypothetical protein